MSQMEKRFLPFFNPSKSSYEEIEKAKKSIEKYVKKVSKSSAREHVNQEEALLTMQSRGSSGSDHGQFSCGYKHCHGAKCDYTKRSRK
jgi:hypothetical protein